MNEESTVFAHPIDSTGAADEPVRVRLEHVPDCPLVDQVRARLHRAVAATRVVPVIEDVEGDYPSPTLIIGGLDVVTGRPASDVPCCRLDLPTGEQILSALQRSPVR